MKRLFLILAAAVVVFNSCSSEKIITSNIPADGKYDTFDANPSSSEYFENIWRSVKLINSIAYYNSYINVNSQLVTLEDFNKDKSKVEDWEKIFFTDNAAGTASILSNNNGNILFLTCAHILNFPDTVITFYSDEQGKPSKYIESISIKVEQDNYMSDLSGTGQVKIIALDDKLDVAVVGGKYEQKDLLKHRIFPGKFGDAAELNWGSLVYVIGYPLNRKMITKGIVSIYESNPNDYFSVDAVFNRGMSGGIVLGVRDGSPNFELVGIVKSAPADSRVVIKPYETKNDFANYPKGPFKGKLKVEKELQMKYGISKVLTINSIISFIKNNEDVIQQEGYYLPDFNFE